ncbi:MAG: flippase-like domain-containing protein [Spirochaetes bacterium]|nr:flippase-like domain-containing protein [Spirochaetota bacterium]
MKNTRIPVNIQRLIVITLLSFLLIGGIIYFTANRQTVASIRNIKVNFMLLGLLFYFLEFSFDAIRTKVLVKGTGHKIKLFECYKLVAFQVFFDLITPFSFGGQPFQIYILHKKKVPGGSATTVVITKLILGGLVLTGIAIWALIFYSHIFAGVPIFKFFVKLTGIILLGASALFIAGLYTPRVTAWFLTVIFKVLWKIKIMKHPDVYKKKVLKHLILARESFDGFIGHRVRYLLIGTILTIFMFLSLIMMILSFLWGFNIQLDILTGITITGSLLFLITFMPTPGSSGLGEGIFYLLYRDYVPSHLIGVAIFLWRFFAQYLTAFIGAVVTGHYGSELLSAKKISDTSEK